METFHLIACLCAVPFSSMQQYGVHASKVPKLSHQYVPTDTPPPKETHTPAPASSHALLGHPPPHPRPAPPPGLPAKYVSLLRHAAPLPRPSFHAPHSVKGFQHPTASPNTPKPRPCIRPVPHLQKRSACCARLAPGKKFFKPCPSFCAPPSC